MIRWMYLLTLFNHFVRTIKILKIFVIQLRDTFFSNSNPVNLLNCMSKSTSQRNESNSG